MPGESTAEPKLLATWEFLNGITKQNVKELSDVLVLHSDASILEKVQQVECCVLKLDVDQDTEMRKAEALKDN